MVKGFYCNKIILICIIGIKLVNSFYVYFCKRKYDNKICYKYFILVFFLYVVINFI